MGLRDWMVAQLDHLWMLLYLTNHPFLAVLISIVIAFYIYLLYFLVQA